MCSELSNNGELAGVLSTDIKQTNVIKKIMRDHKDVWKNNINF